MLTIRVPVNQIGASDIHTRYVYIACITILGDIYRPLPPPGPTTDVALLIYRAPGVRYQVPGNVI